MTINSADNCQTLYEIIQSRTGICLTDHQRDDVALAVQNLCATNRSIGMPTLTLALMREPLTHPLWQTLISIVTVGETYFFRNQYQFDALLSTVLPGLIDKRRKAGFHHLRLWSAGCAGGEEPYSLAMLLRELLPDIETWSIMIWGTDINLAAMERARRGIYRSWSFRSETPEEIRERWFLHKGEIYELKPAIRNMVTFEPLNLTTDSYPDNNIQNIDLIMCRNVTIYFDQPTTRTIVERFYRVLAEDGWLIVGHAEPLAQTYQNLFTPHNFEGTVLYRKHPPEVEASQPIAPPISPPSPPRLPSSPPPSQLFPAAALSLPPSALPPAEPAPAAVKLPESAVKTPEPPKPDYLQQARQAADREDWDAATRWLLAAEHENTFRPEVHYLRALILLQKGNPDQALASLRQAVYCDPAYALAHYSLAELHEKRGETKIAVRHFKLAQTALSGLAADQQLSPDDDITVEMLQQLIDHHLQSIS